MAPAAFVAAKLVDYVAQEGTLLAYVALSEGSALAVAEAARCFAPDVDIVLLPPWDCLPYDRIPPSRQCMGRRMDALRVWSTPSKSSKLLVTSLDAILQRIPPLDVIKTSSFELIVGKAFDRASLRRFIKASGYLEDGLVDEPGEFAFRDDVIDIFPAGQPVPVRIVISEDGIVAELKAYDPKTQRTDCSLERLVLGPASEAIAADDGREDDVAPGIATEGAMVDLYGKMPSLIDFLGREAKISFAPGSDERVGSYLEFIEEARRAHRNDSIKRNALYLDKEEWRKLWHAKASINLDLDRGASLPEFVHTGNPRKSFVNFVNEECASNRTIVLCGEGPVFDGLCRRVRRDKEIRAITRWSQASKAEPGTVLRLSCDLEHGYIDGDLNLVAITTYDVLGIAFEQVGTTRLLAEPELHIGDVVVHEDHGIGVLRELETVNVDGAVHDAARLEYHAGASILVPMHEFGKIWRYGSVPQAVSLDRLNTEGWMKKQEAVARDIRAAARHLLRLAKQRANSAADVYAPPPVEFSRFRARFPYSLTNDQQLAINAVVDDLASGRVMNRLVCGDVGFGKTEVALCATAAVALSGGQVAVVVPTTVLARQHFINFERRFAGSGIRVTMLSRVVEAGEAKRIKTGLATGAIQVVIATQAILAKDVEFHKLGLLVIDEEHRFGTREKKAMRSLAGLLHTLTMSATPIPRTLQAAMAGLQEVSLLTTPPSKRRPVRTSLSTFDRPSMRVALLREQRRGGQSFIVAPQIDDLDRLKQDLDDLVPELWVQVAHGKMPAAAMDQVMVDFADGQGDVLLSTNIIESGLDVPRANTIFVWRADRFGLAQLHQLRGRVGRGRRQGIAYLLTAEGDDISDQTRLRLMTMVENDRLGAGLAISMQDLDLRGGGDITGEDQAGHMKVIGISLYQRLLERALCSANRTKRSNEPANVAVNIGVAGRLPADYIPDATVRLNLYARLFRIRSSSEIEVLGEEFEDRFGEMPEPVTILLRLEKLKIAASRLGITTINAGPRAMALTFAAAPSARAIKSLSTVHPASLRDDRLIYEHASPSGIVRLKFFEKVFNAACCAPRG